MKHPKKLSRLEGKVVVVTGASDGIGVETARYLADLGATLVLPVRNLEKGRGVRDDIARTTGNDKLEVREMDLASLASVRAFAQALRDEHPRIDVLVLNAGVSPQKRALTADGFEMTMGVNHFGHFVLALELVPALKAAGNARVVVVSSALHTSGRIRFDDLAYAKDFSPGLTNGPYPDSKLANALFAVELAERLQGTGVTVNFLHPGVVSTNLARDMSWFGRWIVRTFFSTPEKGAQTSVFVVASPELEGVTGKYYDACREKAPAASVSDAALRTKLWKVTEDLTSTRWQP
jgi:retinol dehydrogenase 13